MMPYLKSVCLFEHSAPIIECYDWKGNRVIVEKKRCGNDIVRVNFQMLVLGRHRRKCLDYDGYSSRNRTTCARLSESCGTKLEG